MQRYPGMCVGPVHVDPWKGKRAMKNLRRGVKELRVRSMDESYLIMRGFANGSLNCVL